jgi:branched-chain amino acid transport system ATP-binding protein
MLLEVRGLSKSFGGVQAVNDLSLNLEAGEIVGMIGPNGAGKTTFFNLLTGFDRPNQGEVRLDGRGILGLKPHQVCKLGLTKTFQITRPFKTMTALQNVMVAAIARGETPHQARRTAANCLNDVGLGHRLEAPADALSTGQRKRLEFARALATRPRILLLDEPAAGVDQKSLPGMIQLIKQLRTQGTTLFIIEHNLLLVRQTVDRVIAMHLGQKIADGNPKVVLEDPQVVSAHLGKQDLSEVKRGAIQ